MAVTIEPNIGEHGTVFVTGRDMGANSVPSIVLASEHYNLIAKHAAAEDPGQARGRDPGALPRRRPRTHNVIAEIPGTDAAVKDEIVMVGAHLDSWHTGTGATDNADGVATIMEAMRILKALGVRPRRTIRAALWAGEEQGLLGSKAYVAEHLAGDKNKAARDKFSVYFNLDNGFPPISGFYMEGNEPARAIMTEWLKPVASLGAIMPSPGHIGATDHLSFIDVGDPGLPGGAGLRQLRRPHAPHQRRLRGANRSGGAEAGVGRDGDGAVSGGDARGHVSQAGAAQEVTMARSCCSARSRRRSRCRLPYRRKTGRRFSARAVTASTPGAPIVASFPRSGPPLLWKRDIGAGFAGPAVAAGKLVLFHRVNNRETVEAMDAATGKTLWIVRLPHQLSRRLRL